LSYSALHEGGVHFLPYHFRCSVFSVFVLLACLISPHAVFAQQDSPPLGDVARQAREQQSQQPKAKKVLNKEGTGSQDSSSGDFTNAERDTCEAMRKLAAGISTVAGTGGHMPKDLDELRASLGGYLADMATAEKEGYRFTYVPSPDDLAKPPMPILKSRYTAQARPVTYGAGGWRSFFADESGYVTCTAEDRPATHDDNVCKPPPIPLYSEAGSEAKRLRADIDQIMNAPPPLSPADIPPAGASVEEKKRRLDQLDSGNDAAIFEILAAVDKCKQSQVANPYSCLSKEQRIILVAYDEWSLAEGRYWDRETSARAASGEKTGMFDNPSVLSMIGGLNAVESNYSMVYSARGYTERFDQLGPSATGRPDENHAGLLFDAMADFAVSSNTVVKSDYRFTYTPGPRNAQGIITSYTITARPLHFVAGQTKSYYTDQNARIRETSEDRLANAQDPFVQ